MGAQKVKGKFAAPLLSQGTSDLTVRRRPAFERGHQGAPRDAEDAGAGAGHRQDAGVPVGGRDAEGRDRTCLTEATANLAVRYKDGASVQVSQTIEMTGFIDQAADQITYGLAKLDPITAANRGREPAAGAAQPGRGRVRRQRRERRPAEGQGRLPSPHLLGRRRQWPDPFAALNKACLKIVRFAGHLPAGHRALRSPSPASCMKDSDEERHQDGVYARLFVNLADFARRRTTGTWRPSTARPTPCSRCWPTDPAAAPRSRCARRREVHMAFDADLSEESSPAGPAELPAGPDVQDRQRRRGGGEEPPGGGAGPDRWRRPSRSPSGTPSGKPRWAKATAAT